MKRLLSFFVVISLLFAFSACKKNNSTDYSAAPTEQRYSVEINMEIIRNSYFSRYDVDLYVDSINIGEVEFGTKYTREFSLTQGEHTLKAIKKGNTTVDGAIVFNVKGNMKLDYKLALSKDQIELLGEAALAEESMIEIHPDNAENTTIEEFDDNNEVEATADIIDDGVLTINNSRFLSELIKLDSQKDKEHVRSLVQSNEDSLIEMDFLVSSVKPLYENSDEFDCQLYIVIDDLVIKTAPVFCVKGATAESLKIDNNEKGSFYQGKFLKMKAYILGYEDDMIILEPVRTVL